MSGRQRLISVFLWVILLSWGTSFGVNASPVEQALPPPTPIVDGLNLVLVIDQSGSMGGLNFGSSTPIYGTDGTDPNGLRFAGPQYTLQHLNYLATSASQANLPDLNLAVVTFGTFPRDILNWVKIAPNQPAWQDDLTAVLDDLSVNRWLNRNLGETDFERAFEEVVRLFDNNPGIQPGAVYRNVVVVLTDGAPCSSTDPAFQEPQADGRIFFNCVMPAKLNAMQQHLQRLRAFTGGRLPASDFDLYVIALDVGVPTPYWDQLESNWAQIVCNGVAVCDPALRHAKVDSPSEIGAQINRILGDAVQGVFPAFLSANVPFPPGVFEVPPFQQSIRLDVFRVGQNTPQVTFLSNELPVQPTTTIGGLSTIDLFEFSTPTAGRWEISFSDPSLVESVQLNAIPAVMTTDLLTSAEVFSTQPITLRLARSDGTSLPADPTTDANYTLIATAQVYDATLIDRDARPLIGAPIPLTRTADTSIYEYTGDWTPLTPARVEVRVDVSYIRNSDGATQPLQTGQTIVDGLTVAGAYVDWREVSPISQRVDKNFEVNAWLINAETSAPLSNPSNVQIRVEIIGADDVPRPTVTLSNRGQAPGELISPDLRLNEVGVFNVRFEAIYDDGSGVPVVLGNASGTRQLETRPVQPLVLRFLQPSAGDQEAQRFSLSPFELNLNVPLDVQVETFNELTQQRVSLATATGNAENRPRLLMNGDDLTPHLTELQPGVYALRLDDIGMGQYTLTASASTPSDALVGDYVWSTNVINAQNAQVTVNRVLSSALLFAVLVLVASLIMIVVVGYVLWRRNVYLTQFPLKGNVTFGWTTGDDTEDNIVELPQASFDFGKRTAFRQTFTAQIPTFGKLKVTFTTRRKQDTSENGRAYVENLTLNGEKVSFARELIPGEMPSRVTSSKDGQTVLWIMKDSAFDVLGGGLTGYSGKADDNNVPLLY